MIREQYHHFLYYVPKTYLKQSCFYLEIFGSFKRVLNQHRNEERIGYEIIRRIILFHFEKKK